MTKLVPNIPWFIVAAGVLGLAAAIAVVFQALGGPYFERTRLDEASPLEGFAVATPMADATAEVSASPSSDATPTATAAAADAPGVLAQGEWRDGEPGHNGEGIAKIIRTPEGTLVLRVEEFSVTNGPDLYMVLSADDDGYSDDNVNLGRLRATDGNVNYEIPVGTDISRYRSVVVWCDDFNVLFAYAALEEA
jgi:hypothetical protein